VRRYIRPQACQLFDRRLRTRRSDFRFGFAGANEGICGNFHAPRRRRYVRRPAQTDENGIVDLPRAPLDPVPLATAAALLCLGVAIRAGYFDEKEH
jgi:hypothetical protein